jgi:hypothetical protein
MASWTGPEGCAPSGNKCFVVSATHLLLFLWQALAGQLTRNVSYCIQLGCRVVFDCRGTTGRNLDGTFTRNFIEEIDWGGSARLVRVSRSARVVHGQAGWEWLGLNKRGGEVVVAPIQTGPFYPRVSCLVFYFF